MKRMAHAVTSHQFAHALSMKGQLVDLAIDLLRIEGLVAVVKG